MTKATGRPRTGRPPRPAAERFAAKWKLDASTGCHVWQGRLDPHGYGKFKMRRRTMGAHRAAVEMARGPVPSGMYIDHICRNRACVNPEHLRMVSPAQNVLENSESVQAANKAKTHCIHGHELTPSNTYNYGGSRKCKTCQRKRRAEHRARHAA